MFWWAKLQVVPKGGRPFILTSLDIIISVPYLALETSSEHVVLLELLRISNNLKKLNLEFAYFIFDCKISSRYSQSSSFFLLSLLASFLLSLL